MIMKTQLPRRRIEHYRKEHSKLASVDVAAGPTLPESRPGARRFILWRSIVHYALRSLGRQARFDQILERIEQLVPPGWLYNNWEAKVAYLLRKDPTLARVGKNTWHLRRRGA